MDGDDVLPSASSDVVALKSDDAAAPGAGAAAEEVEESRVELIAKWRGEEIVLDPVPVSSTVLLVKLLLQSKTNVLPERQKLVGLKLKGSVKPAPDDAPLTDLVLNKKPLRFTLLGTPEAELFVDPADKEDLPEVFDDLDMDVSFLSDEWRRSVQNSDNLKRFTASTVVHLINAPRPNKRLLVLDLDHTLLDFSSRGQSVTEGMRRPFVDDFLAAVYVHYDLVVWSQTSWKWLEYKMVELGLLTHPHYRFCFVLDKTSMFHVESTKPNGDRFEHQVKPLQIIWTKFPQWGEGNTLHIDDLSRNFALNQSNGVKIKAYKRSSRSAAQDDELRLLKAYLVDLATRDGGKMCFKGMSHDRWRETMEGGR